MAIELHDFGDAKIPERFAGSADRTAAAFSQEILAGTNQLKHLVDAVSHIVLRSVFSRTQVLPPPRSLTSPNQGRKDARTMPLFGLPTPEATKPPESRWPGAMLPAAIVSGLKLLERALGPQVEYLNSGIAFSSSLVALITR